MKIGILVAMEEEIKRLTEEISEVSIQKIAKQTFYDGKIYNHPVTIVQSGIGKVSAATATSLLIETFNVDVVINTGSAGAISSNLRIGNLVIAKSLAYNDVDNRIFGYEYGQIPQMDSRFFTDQKLVQSIEKTAMLQDWDIQTGLIVTGDSFVSNQEEIKSIKEFFPNALVTEMEGAAVGQTCSQFDIPFAVIRAVSDTADDTADIDFDKFVISAGKKSAELVMALIQEISKTQTI